MDSALIKHVVPVDGLEDSSVYGYSQCVRVGPFVYVAGQCGLGLDHEVVSDDFETQARAALDRISIALEAVGGTMDDIVTMTVFITDTSLGRIFTSLRRRYFSGDYPASALIGVSQLMVPGAQIEIQATAVLSGQDTGVSTPGA